MPWIGDFELAKSIDDLKTSQSIAGWVYSNFEIIGARLATASRTTVQGSSFNKSISFYRVKPPIKAQQMHQLNLSRFKADDLEIITARRDPLQDLPEWLGGCTENVVDEKKSSSSNETTEFPEPCRPVR